MIEGHLGASCPFSRERQDWRVTPPRKYTYTGHERKLKEPASTKPPTHYVPRGERSAWSKAQYTVYKEEKRAGREERWIARKLELDAIAKDITTKANSRWRSITDGHRNRSILGEVAGRKDGQPAIEKEERGLPLVDKVEKEEKRDSDGDGESESEDDYDSAKEKPGSAAKLDSQRSRLDQIVKDAKKTQSTSKGLKRKSRKRGHMSDSGDDDEDGAGPTGKGPKKKIKKSKNRKQTSVKEWVVPDSSDDGGDELDHMRKQGLRIIHDYWPSAWRAMAAAIVSTERINKTVRSTSHSVRSLNDRMR